jgi:hypothetical protein
VHEPPHFSVICLQHLLQEAVPAELHRTKHNTAYANSAPPGAAKHHLLRTTLIKEQTHTYHTEIQLRSEACTCWSSSKRWNMSLTPDTPATPCLVQQAHAETAPHTASYSLTQPHTASHTQPHTASYSLTQPHTASHGLTQPHAASHSLTWPHTASHSLTQPHTASHSLTQPHTASHSLTWPHTASHSLTQPHTASHSLIQPHTAPPGLQELHGGCGQDGPTDI